MKKVSRGILGPYTKYYFTDHDPVLDKLDRLFELSAPAGQRSLKTQEIANQTSVSAGTIANWRRRKTKKPQFATVAAVVNGLGGELVVSYKGKLIRGKAPPLQVVAGTKAAKRA